VTLVLAPRDPELLIFAAGEAHQSLSGLCGRALRWHGYALCWGGIDRDMLLDDGLPNYRRIPG